MSKYKQLYQEMVETHKKEFDYFKRIHDLYRHDPKNWQVTFNQTGKQILEIARKWEKRLCGKMENSGHSAFSGNLSEKFWEEIKKDFPSIGMVGIINQD